MVEAGHDPLPAGTEKALALGTLRTILGQISTAFRQRAGSQDQSGEFDPDIPAMMTASDGFAGRDRALEAIVVGRLAASRARRAIRRSGGKSGVRRAQCKVASDTMVESVF